LNQRQVDQMMGEIIEYANLPGDTDLSKRLWRLWKFCFDQGVTFSWHGRMDRVLLGNQENYLQARPLAIRDSLRSTLDVLIEGGEVDISFSGVVNGEVSSGGASGLWLNLKDQGGDEYILGKLMAYLMLFSGVKSVRKCLGCGDYILLKKNNGRKACGKRCKQRIYQMEMSKEKKRQQREARSVAYHRKKGIKSM